MVGVATNVTSNTSLRPKKGYVKNMPIKKRLINCDYFNTSGFTNLSNKAKLLYFYFLTNADDKGFVGNGKDIAETLDKCEEEQDNVLFNYKYVDALHELVDKHLVYAFSDKLGNITYLIRHWFMHNKNQGFLTTNFISYLAKVELVNDEYQLKTIKGENLKEKEIKENENKVNKNLKSNSLKKFNDNDLNSEDNGDSEKDNSIWDELGKLENDLDDKNDDDTLPF